MIDSHILNFRRYVEGFLTGETEHDGHIRLKEEHSLMVLEEARSITNGIGLSGTLLRASLLGALFHDTGRFQQYKRWNTFKDAISANHAQLGVRELRSIRALSGEEDSVRALALGAVVMHNRRELPSGISEDLTTVTQVVRDSDKLDIIRIMLDHMRPGGKRSDVVMLHVADEPDKYSSPIVAQILEGRIGDYALMRYANDFKLLMLSWVHDLTYRPSRKAFLDRGYLDELTGLLPSTPELTQVKDRIYDVLNR